MAAALIGRNAGSNIMCGVGEVNYHKSWKGNAWRVNLHQSTTSQGAILQLISLKSLSDKFVFYSRVLHKNIWYLIMKKHHSTHPLWYVVFATTIISFYVFFVFFIFYKERLYLIPS